VWANGESPDLMMHVCMFLCVCVCTNGESPDMMMEVCVFLRSCVYVQIASRLR